MPIAPILDPGTVLAGGRARRRRRTRVRRTAGGLLSVAVLVAGLVGLALWSPEDEAEPVKDGAPATVADLPVGSPPHLPYCQDGRAIVGAGAPIASSCMTMTSHAGSTIGWNDEGVYRIADSRLDRLSGRIQSSWVPTLSQDGRFAAWVTDAPEPTLLVYDARTGRRLTEVPMPTASGWTAGFDARGRVYFNAYDVQDPVWMYDIAARQLVRLQGIPPMNPPGIRYVTADGIGLDLGEHGIDRLGDPSVIGTVDPDGRFVGRGEVPIGWSSWAPDFSHLVQETRAGFSVQASSGSARRVTLKLPREGLPTVNPVWESDDSVLVVFYPGAPWDAMIDDDTQGDIPSELTYILRCSTSTGECEIALRPGYGGDMRGPMYR